MSKERKNPADFLKKMLGKSVEVKLNDNLTFFQGTLSCLDGTMNVLLSGVKEIVKGETINEFKEVLLRGNNVLYIKKNYWMWFIVCLKPKYINIEANSE